MTEGISSASAGTCSSELPMSIGCCMISATSSWMFVICWPKRSNTGPPRSCNALIKPLSVMLSASVGMSSIAIAGTSSAPPSASPRIIWDTCAWLAMSAPSPMLNMNGEKTAPNGANGSEVGASAGAGAGGVEGITGGPGHGFGRAGLTGARGSGAEGRGVGGVWNTTPGGGRVG